MDLNTVTGFRSACERTDLALAPGERFVAGGTWLFSEPQPGITGLVDLTTMNWDDVEYGASDDGDALRIGATCTIATLAAVPGRPGQAAHPLFHQCATALLASYKIWNLATVGGNICQSFAAAGMVSLAVALDGTAHLWRPDGTDRFVPVAELITGNGTNNLARGEVLRSISLPGYALRARTGFRKIALAELGRSGAVLTGRVDEDGTALFAITAATLRPTRLRFGALPGPGELADAVAAVDGWYTDPLGTADWRRQVSRVLLEEIRAELAG